MSDRMMSIHFERGQCLNESAASTICFSFLAQRLRLEECSDLGQSQPHAASYWMAHAAMWPVSGYAPQQPLSSAFLVPKVLSSYLAQLSFFEALALPGQPGLPGAAEHLIREGVAGLLNSGHPNVNYPLSRAEIIDLVNTALASGSVEEVQQAAFNLFICNNSRSELQKLSRVAAETEAA